MRIGRSGFTFPTSTEHKGVCTYSATKQLCPLPPGCRNRLPVVVDHVNRFKVKEKRVAELCGEYPRVQRIGYYIPPAEEKGGK